MGFPNGFLWGAATAGHQVEGGNVNADIWPLEWAQDSMFAEPSSDACDVYHRYYPEDLSLLSKLGFNAYRFSVEWSRIEPEAGFVSRAALDHDQTPSTDKDAPPPAQESERLLDGSAVQENVPNAGVGGYDPARYQMGLISADLEVMASVHRLAKQAIKTIAPQMKVGWTLALPYLEPVAGGEAHCAASVASRSDRMVRGVVFG